MVQRICKIFRFEAAHQLEDWPAEHQCRRLHGHSYKVELELQGIPKSTLTTRIPGAIEDFGHISEVWRETIHRLVDHQNLNAVTQMRNTTAEGLAWWIYSKMNEVLPGLTSVRVWETETAWAEFRPAQKGSQ